MGQNIQVFMNDFIQLLYKDGQAFYSWGANGLDGEVHFTF